MCVAVGVVDNLGHLVGPQLREELEDALLRLARARERHVGQHVGRRQRDKGLCLFATSKIAARLREYFVIGRAHRRGPLVGKPHALDPPRVGAIIASARPAAAAASSPIIHLLIVLLRRIVHPLLQLLRVLDRVELAAYLRMRIEQRLELLIRLLWRLLAGAHGGRHIGTLPFHERPEHELGALG